MRIVFLGTPDFSVASLKAVHEAQHSIVGVVTMPDKAGGRGQKIRFSPVKQYALEHDLKILQPPNLKDKGFLSELRALKADLQIVVAFRMLPEVVWNMPEFGTFSLHASLLPQYRGAAPINWAVMNGETKTGVTTFFLKHQIDTGDVIYQTAIDITKDDTAGIVHDKLMVIGANLVAKTVKAIANGTFPTKSQVNLSDTGLKEAPKIHKDTCKIDWNLPSETVYNKIRGLSPYPTAWCNINGSSEMSMKIYNSHHSQKTHNEVIGSIHSDNKSFIEVYCSNGTILLDEIQLQGKKGMKVADFLNGYDINDIKKLN